MSVVAKYTAAVAGSAFFTAIGLGLLSGIPADLLVQPYYWVITFSIAALAGLAMGDGIGGRQRHRSIGVSGTRPNHSAQMGALA